MAKQFLDFAVAGPRRKLCKSSRSCTAFSNPELTCSKSEWLMALDYKFDLDAFVVRQHFD